MRTPFTSRITHLLSHTLLLLIATCGGDSGTQPGAHALFGPPTNYAAGDQPVSVCSADLDGDGDSDLALVTWGSNTDNLSVLLNNGDGTFADKVDYVVGDYPHSVFAEDLDGDGDNDLTVTNAYSFPPTVSVLMNNGDATFADKIDYPVGDSPHSVFSADLDGDGHNDLTVANWESDNVSVLLNSGDGTFAPKVDYAVGDGPSSVFISDLDGDGDNDVAVSNVGSDNVSVLMNSGDGTFAPAVDHAVGDGPWSIFVSDLDGDGDSDLTVANFGLDQYDDTVSVLMNNGDGTFASKVDYDAGLSPSSVFVADLDGDGDDDLAVANRYSDNVSVLMNNSDGTFAPKVDYDAGVNPTSVFIADFDGDGDNDLTVSNVESDNVSVFLNLSTRP